MADLISREAALDAIFGCFNVMESKGIDMTVARTIVKGVLDGVPAVDAVPMVMAGAELTDAELIEEIRKAPIVLKPNVDAVPVVRCKDCMYFRPWRHDRGEDSRCEFWNAEIGAEDYCSQAIYLNNKMDSERRASECQE